MADKWPAGNGNWSTAANWNGGTKPQAGDDVYADGFTVTIDEDVSVGSLRTTARSGGSAGGGFSVTAGGRSITLSNTTTALWPGTTTVLTCSHATGTVTLVATGAAGIAHNGATNSTNCVTLSGAGALTVTAPAVTGGSGARNAFQVSGNGTLTATATTFVSGSSGGTAITLSGATPTVNLTGDLTNGGGSQALSLTGGVSAATVTILGNVYCPSTSNTQAVIWAGAGTLNITGNLVAGTPGSSSNPLSLAATSPTVTIVGTIYGSHQAYAIIGTGAPTITITGAVRNAGVSMTGAAAVTINGALEAGPGATTLDSSNVTATNILSGPFIAHPANGYWPVYCRRITLSQATNTYITFAKAGGGTVQFVSTDTVAGQPPVGDVRSGTTYGAQTGTLVVPSAADVAAGVEVDNTTGTAQLTPASLWDYLVASATTPGSMGERLANAASAAAFGAQVAALQGV